MTTEDDSDAQSAEEDTPDQDEERTTAPMSDFTRSDVTMGFLVLFVGLVIAYAIPILFV